MHLRKISVFGAVISASLLLASCGSGSGSDENTITLLDGWTDEPAKSALDDLLKKYEDEHEGVTIERTTVPFGDIRTTLIQDVSSNSAPDVVFFDSPDTQTLAAEDVLASIEDHTTDWETKDLYFEGAWDSTQYEDETYGIPLYSDAAGIYANMDLLEDAGIDEIPETWSEFSEAIEATTGDDKYGLCFGTTPYESASYLILPFIWQTGGDIDDLENSAIPGLEFFENIMEKDQAPEDAVSWSWDDSMNQFLNGQCGIVFGGPWDSVDVGEADFEAEAASVPYKDDGEPASVLGGFNIGTSQGADNDKAWEFIDWFTQEDNLGDFLTTKQQLPNREDLSDLEFIEEDPLLEAFVDAIEVAKPRDYGSDWPEMSEALQKMTQAVVGGKESPEEAAANASSVIVPLLDNE